MVGKRKARSVYRDTKKISGAGIRVVIGEITKIDAAQITVTVSGKEYSGDHMIISLGVEQVEEHSLNSFGHDFYTLDGAEEFSKQLKQFKGGKIAILVSSLPFKCPAAPYEASMLVESYLRKNGLRDKTEVALYSPELGPMGVAGKELSGAVRQMVEMKGIKYYPEYKLSSATENSLTFCNGEIHGYDLLAYTPGHQCPAVVRDAGLAGESGWVHVNRETLETGFPNVYAIGDITYIGLEMGKPLPMAGVFAHYQADTVAHNIARKINSKEADRVFTGDGQCFLEMGEGKAGYAGGNFYQSPLPAIKMKKPGYFWHLSKVWFEKYWFFKHF